MRITTFIFVSILFGFSLAAENVRNKRKINGNLLDDFLNSSEEKNVTDDNYDDLLDISNEKNITEDYYEYGNSVENVKGNDSLGLFHQNATSFIPGTATQVTKSTDLDYDNTTSSKTVHEVDDDENSVAAGLYPNIKLELTFEKILILACFILIAIVILLLMGLVVYFAHKSSNNAPKFNNGLTVIEKDAWTDTSSFEKKYFGTDLTSDDAESQV